MTRKISLGITAILIIASIVISSVVTLFFVLRTYDNLLVDLPQRAEQYLKLGELDELVRSEYYGSFDDTSVDDSLATGFISGLKDPFSFYVSADDVESYKNFLDGRMEGIGLNAYYDNSLSKMIVSFVYDHSPAAEAGIEVDDFILSVNGKSVTSENYASLLTAMTTGFDNKVTVTFGKAAGEEAQENSSQLTTGYEIKSCSYLIDNSVGYIRLTSFYESTFTVFSEAVEHFINNKINNVIIDLRNSSGQNYDVAAKIIDYIVPVGSEGTGAVYSAKNSKGETVVQYASDSSAVNMSFVVLVNDRTEAAAELVAVDLRDFGKGILLGEKTAGFGTMQKLFSLSDGDAVYLSVAEIYPYISGSFNNKGIAPDIVVESSEAFKNQLGSDDFSDDEQYKTAVSYFTGKN